LFPFSSAYFVFQAIHELMPSYTLEYVSESDLGNSLENDLLHENLSGEDKADMLYR
jgi:hypothetical protein